MIKRPHKQRDETTNKAHQLKLLELPLIFFNLEEFAFVSLLMIVSIDQIRANSCRQHLASTFIGACCGDIRGEFL